MLGLRTRTEYTHKVKPVQKEKKRETVSCKALELELTTHLVSRVLDAGQLGDDGLPGKQLLQQLVLSVLH
jgi:hypothetical protein